MLRTKQKRFHVETHIWHSISPFAPPSPICLRPVLVELVHVHIVVVHPVLACLVLVLVLEVSLEISLEISL